MEHPEAGRSVTDAPEREEVSADVRVVSQDDTTVRDPSAALLLVVFTVIAVLLAFPNLSRFRSYVAGDSSDAYLNLWIMRSVQHALPHGWNALWNQPIYQPAANTLAYSDTLFPVALLHGVLRAAVGDTAAFNIIYLASWVVSSWCMYRLARRFVAHWGAAFVAALVYTYSSIRLGQHIHFQLVVGGALVPLALLLLLRLLDRPTPWRGAGLGATVAALTLTASYYGPMTAIIIAIFTVGWLVVFPTARTRAFAISAAVAFGVLGLLSGPFVLKYLQLESDPYFRRRFEPARAAHLADFFTGGAHNYLLSHLPALSSLFDSARNVEHRMFPGFVAIAFGVLGIIACVQCVRRQGFRSQNVVALFLIAIGGLAFLALSFGDWREVAGHRIPLPFAFFRRYVPGYSGVRGLSRLALPAQLALALFAAVGVNVLLKHVRPARRLAVVAALSVLVVAESTIAVQYVRIPTARDDGGVDVALQHLPHGLVLELPIASPREPTDWIYNEPSRQLVALRDGNPRVNGYSGFAPPDFAARAITLNHFPQPDALAELARLRVQYVVLRTRLVGDIEPRTARQVVDANRVGRYDDATAQGLIAGLPPNLGARVEKLPGAYLVVLP